jgi:hypothetical protein
MTKPESRIKSETRMTNGAHPWARINSDLGESRVTNVADADAALDRIVASLAPARPAGVVVERANGDALVAVLGAPEGAMLSFTRADGLAPYFVTLGDPSAEGVIDYWLAGDHHSQAERWTLVATETARKAIRQFLTMERGLPGDVTWASV